jgi:hypothetical protein
VCSHGDPGRYAAGRLPVMGLSSAARLRFAICVNLRQSADDLLCAIPAGISAMSRVVPSKEGDRFTESVIREP